MNTSENTSHNLSEFLNSYIETALWSSTYGDNGEYNLDDGEHELSDEARAKMAADCERFQSDYTRTVNALDYTSDDFPERQIAHDFWLTRNGHGAGFWDGDYPDKVGKALTDLAHSYGECDLYLGDDGKIYA